LSFAGVAVVAADAVVAVAVGWVGAAAVAAEVAAAAAHAGDGAAGAKFHDLAFSSRADTGSLVQSEPIGLWRIGKSLISP